MKTSEEITDIIMMLDRRISALVAATCFANGVTNQSQQAAVTISLAAMIAGRAEVAIEHDDACKDLYDEQREVGRDAARRMQAKRKPN